MASVAPSVTAIKTRPLIDRRGKAEKARHERVLEKRRERKAERHALKKALKREQLRATMCQELLAILDKWSARQVDALQVVSAPTIAILDSGSVLRLSVGVQPRGCGVLPVPLKLDLAVTEQRILPTDEHKRTSVQTYHWVLNRRDPGSMEYAGGCDSHRAPTPDSSMATDMQDPPAAIAAGGIGEDMLRAWLYDFGLLVANHTSRVFAAYVVAGLH